MPVPTPSSRSPWVQLTVTDDDDNGSRTARVTVTVDQRMHRFEIEVFEKTVVIDHQETVNRRGSVVTVEPPDSVVKRVASHEKVQEFIDGDGND